MSGRALSIDIPGLMVPALTPFDGAGKVDFKKLQDEVDYLISDIGPSAITVAGVEAQEYHYLTSAERRELISETAKAIGKRRPFVVGISHPSVRQAAELAGLAESLGAAGVQLLIPNRPFGGAAPVEELCAYFAAVARETTLPIVAYHNPGPGANLTVGELKRIAEVEGVAAFKESSRNMRHIGRAIEEIDHGGLARYFTTMEVLLPSLMLGGSGGTLPPPAAETGQQIVDAYKAGDFERAARLQRLFAAFPARWMPFGLTAVMKVAMAALGHDIGDTYPPFGEVPETVRQEIRAYLKNTSLIEG